MGYAERAHDTVRVHRQVACLFLDGFLGAALDHQARLFAEGVTEETSSWWNRVSLSLRGCHHHLFTWIVDLRVVSRPFSGLEGLY